MTRAKQKQTEVRYANSLSTQMNYDWRVEGSPDERSWPDLIIKTPRDKFGLEVRNYYVAEASCGSIVKKNESTRQKLLKKLARDYYTISDCPILLKIAGLFTQKTMPIITKTLISSNISSWKKKEKELFINSIKTKLIVKKLPEYVGYFDQWTYIDDNSNWSYKISENDIERIAKDKSRHIKKYTTNLSTVSLLIVADGAQNSGKITITKQRNINTYGFKKVYFYMHPSRTIIYEAN